MTNLSALNLDELNHIGFLVNRAVPNSLEISGLSGRTYSAIAYRPECSFLYLGIGDCFRLRTDRTVIPEMDLCYLGGRYFIVKDIGPESISHGNISSLERITTRSYANFVFESIMGYLVESCEDAYGAIIHTYSGGLELNSISHKTPLGLRKHISNLMASTFAELHLNDIIYTTPVPSNIRYDFSKKLILNPHLYMDYCASGESAKIQDLALFLTASPWVPSVDRFVLAYADHVGYPDKWRTLRTRVMIYLDDLSAGHELPPGIDHYWLRSLQ